MDRINPFKSIYDICNLQNVTEKNKNTGMFPKYIDIELTNSCNFKCLMCPVGNKSMQREKGFMPFEVYSKIIDEIKGYNTPLRFIRWGEPMLHPQFYQYVSLAKKAGLKVHINTNGSLLTEELMEKLLEIEIDSIKFSFQGVDEKSYREMRNIDFFEDLLKTIEKFYKKRGERLLPYIHISTTITYESKEQVHNFKDRVKGICDLVTVGRTVLSHINLNEVKLSLEEVEMLKKLKGEESVVKKHPVCAEVFDKLSIDWDGKVTACCSDYDNMMLIGDVTKNTIKELWSSDILASYRCLLSKGCYNSLSLCKDCFDYIGIQNPGLQD